MPPPHDLQEIDRPDPRHPGPGSLGDAGPLIRAEMVASAREIREFTDRRPPEEAGACVAFSGVVRDHDGGRTVRELEYSGHPIADRVILRVAEQIAAGHPEVSSVRVAHRIGLLQIGDCALYAEVCAPHRGAAFAACSDLVDEVKKQLPVWKRQVFGDGTDEWVNSP